MDEVLQQIRIKDEASEQRLLELGKENRKLLFPIENGKLITPDGLIVNYRLRDNLLRISTIACKRAKRMNFRYDVRTDQIYDTNADMARYIILLIRGAMFASLYEQSDLVCCSKKDEVRKIAQHNVLMSHKPKKQNREISLVKRQKSPETEEKAPEKRHYTRPEEKVFVRGHMRKLRDGRETFVRGYYKYAVAKDPTNPSTYAY